MTKDELCAENGIFAENDEIILERLSEKYKDEYMDLGIEVSCIKKAYEDEEFKEYVWKHDMEDDDLLLCILNKNDNMFIGRMTFRNLSDDKPEIGIDIIEKYRRQGYGFQAVSLFVERLKSISPIEICTVRIYSDNIPSKNLFKKFDIHEIERKDSEFTITMNELKK